jgi:hypothetical protein
MWSTCHCAHLEVLALIHHKHLENHYKKKHVNASHCAHFIGHLIILACPNFSLAPNQDKGLHPTSSIRNNTLGLSLTSHLNLRHLTYLNWSWAMKLVIASVGVDNSSPSFCFLKIHVLNLKHHISSLLTPLTNYKGFWFWHVISSSIFTQMPLWLLKCA